MGVVEGLLAGLGTMIGLGVLGAVSGGDAACGIEGKGRPGISRRGFTRSAAFIQHADELRAAGREEEALNLLGAGLVEKAFSVCNLVEQLESGNRPELKRLVERDLAGDFARGVPVLPLGKAHREFMRDCLRREGGGQGAMVKCSGQWVKARLGVEGVNTLDEANKRRKERMDAFKNFDQQQAQQILSQLRRQGIAATVTPPQRRLPPQQPVSRRARVRR